MKGRSGAGGHLDVPAGTSEQQTDGRDQHYHRSKAADAKIVIEGNSQRRPDRHRHIGRHAVPEITRDVWIAPTVLIPTGWRRWR